MINVEFFRNIGNAVDEYMAEGLVFSHSDILAEISDRPVDAADAEVIAKLKRDIDSVLETLHGTGMMPHYERVVRTATSGDGRISMAFYCPAEDPVQGDCPAEDPVQGDILSEKQAGTLAEALTNLAEALTNKEDDEDTQTVDGTVIDKTSIWGMVKATPAGVRPSYGPVPQPIKDGKLDPIQGGDPSPVGKPRDWRVERPEPEPVAPVIPVDSMRYFVDEDRRICIGQNYLAQIKAVPETQVYLLPERKRLVICLDTPVHGGYRAKVGPDGYLRLSRAVTTEAAIDNIGDMRIESDGEALYLMPSVTPS